MGEMGEGGPNVQPPLVSHGDAIYSMVSIDNDTVFIA